MSQLAHSPYDFGLAKFMQSETATGPQPPRHGSRAVTDTEADLTVQAKLLGWAGNPHEAARVRDRLVLGASLAIPLVLREVENAPRAEITDQASAVLARIAERGSVLPLVATLTEPQYSALSRATVARALGQASLNETFARTAVSTLAKLAADPSPDVRDAAVAALADRGGSQARAVLEQARRSETIGFIVEAIDAALEEC